MHPKKIWIPSGRYQIQADLYLNSTPAPLIIMAHGLGGEKVASLDLYINFYTNQGYNVCCFDYRGFGSSTGKYKNLVDKKSQLADWQTVIAYLKAELKLTNQQLILWGYSFSGAHVLKLASDNQYKGIIANFPHVDGIASVAKYPLPYLLPAGGLAVIDMLYSLFGRTKNMRVVSKNRFAVLSGKDCFDGYQSLIPANTQWDNQVPARIMVTIGFYRPINVVHKIRCPTLLIGATQDSLIPIKNTRKAAKKSSHIHYFEENCGHFDLFRQPFTASIQTKHSHFLRTL